MDRMLSYASLVSTAFLSSASLTSSTDTTLLDIESETLIRAPYPMASSKTDNLITIGLASTSSSVSPNSRAVSTTLSYCTSSTDLSKDHSVSNGYDVDTASTIVKRSPKISVVSRKQKTLAEKQRRDKLNDCFHKLTLLVPTVATAKKRIDKSSVLRLAASYLRFHKGLVNGLANSSGWRPCFTDSKEFETILLQATGGFLMLVNKTYHIIYVTDEIQVVLGHVMVDVIGRSIYSLVHPDDQEAFKSHVTSMKDSGIPDSAFQPSSARCDFFCSMLVHSTSHMHSSDQYDLVQVVAHLKAVKVPKNGGGTMEELYTFVVKPCIMRPNDGIMLERRLGTYFLKMSLDGHLLFTDHWFSMILGHLPSEVVGISGFDFVFDDDILLGLIAHRHLLFQDEMTVIPLRLITITKSPIFVIAASKLVHTNDVSVQDTVLINMKIISLKEGERTLAVFKRNLSITESNSDRIPGARSEHSIQGGRLDMTFGLSPRRPRGRPKKYLINHLGFCETPTQLPFNSSDQPDVCLEVMKWSENFKANNNSITDLRTACKEMLVRNAEIYNGAIKCLTAETAHITKKKYAIDNGFNQHFIEVDKRLGSSLKRKSIGISSSNVTKQCRTSEMLSL